MTPRIRVVLQLTVLCLALAVSSFASANVYLYVVNGIPGRDIAANLNPGFPIDISIDGDCLVRGLTFDNTSGPLSFSAGTYDLQISESNSLAACTNPPVVTAQVALTGGTSMSAVAALNSVGQPTLLQFSDDLSPVATGDARFVFANSADASGLEATLTQVGVKNPKIFTVTAAPGAKGHMTVPSGSYLIQVFASGSTTVLASEQIALNNQSVTLTYAVGETANNSIGLINRVVRDVF
jgi:Domain of unknown function (DUF4397)